MPYFLNAPASMATNSGACSKDMAGTDTLIVFSAISAEKVGADDENNKTVRKIWIAHRFMIRSFPQLVRPDYPKRKKMSSLVLKLSRSFFNETEPATAGAAKSASELFSRKIDYKIDLRLRSNQSR